MGAANRRWPSRSACDKGKVKQSSLALQEQFAEKTMKILGLLVCVLGWLIAVLSVKVPGVYVQLVIATLGVVVAAIGALAIVNRAHLKDAIWKA